MTKEISMKRISEVLTFCESRINVESDPEFDLGISLNTTIAKTFVTAMEDRLKDPLVDEFKQQALEIEKRFYIKDTDGHPKRFPIQGNPNAFRYVIGDLHEKEKAIEGWLESNKKVKKAVAVNKQRREKMLAKEFQVDFHLISLEAAKKAHLTPGAYSLLLDAGILDVPAPKIPDLDDLEVAAVEGGNEDNSEGLE